MLNPTPGKPVSAGTHHPGADVGEVIAVAMQHVLPDKAVPQTYKTGIPTIIVGVDPRTGADVHRPLGRGLRGLVQRGEGHGRVGRAERELRQPVEGDRRDQRERSTRTCSGAATTAPTPAARASGAASAASHYEKEVRVDAKVYTYVVGMKYPMPGICGGEQRRAERDDHPLRLRRPVRRRSTPPTGCRSQAGERIMYDYGGGGGWGDPLDRDPQAVLDDVLDEYVSRRGRRAATTASCSPARSTTSRSRSTTRPPTHCAPSARASRVPVMGYRVGVDVGGTFTDLICVTADGESCSTRRRPRSTTSRAA